MATLGTRSETHIVLFSLILLVSAYPHSFEKNTQCLAMREKHAKDSNILITGGTIITVASNEDNVIQNGVIAVCNGTIVYVGKNDGFQEFKLSGKMCRANEFKLSKNDVVAPAFINAHTHAAMSLFKNLGNDLDLQEWLGNFIFPLEASVVDEKFCKVGSALAMAEMLAGGTSTFADMYFFQDQVANVVERVGMRAYLGQGIIDFPQPDSSNPENTLKIAEEYIKKWTNHPLVHPFIAPHAPYTTSASVYKKAVALNRKYGARTWTHCSETQSENEDTRRYQNLGVDTNITATQFLNDIGVLGSDLTCAHSVWLSDSDIRLYKKTKTSAAHCPSSNLKLASGFMRYSAMDSAGISIAIGTDGQASNNDLDVVEEARLASFIHKGRDLNPLTLPAIEALRHLTMGGAMAIGQSEMQGSIEVGKYGDFAIFGGNSVKWTPRFDIYSDGTLNANDTAANIIYNSNANDVRATVVNGKLLYVNDCYTTLPVEDVIWQSRFIARDIQARLNN